MVTQPVYFEKYKTSSCNPINSDVALDRLVSSATKFNITILDKLLKLINDDVSRKWVILARLSICSQKAIDAREELKKCL